MPAEFFLPWRCIEGCWRISFSVAFTWVSAHPCIASRPNSRISSTIRSSIASASLRFSPEFATAMAIDANRSRRPGCASRIAENASSLSFAAAICQAPLDSRIDSIAHHFESHPARARPELVTFFCIVNKGAEERRLQSFSILLEAADEVLRDKGRSLFRDENVAIDEVKDLHGEILEALVADQEDNRKIKAAPAHEVYQRGSLAFQPLL